MIWLRILLTAALSALLLFAAWGDLRTRIIPNRLNAAIALLAPLWWLASGYAVWPDMLLQLGVALLLFLVFAGFFVLGAMGGGDVKLIAALALWLPPYVIPTMLTVMAVAGGVLTLVVLVLHRIRRPAGPPEVPYGIAIALAGLTIIANDILTIGVH